MKVAYGKGIIKFCPNFVFVVLVFIKIDNRIHSWGRQSVNYDVLPGTVFFSILNVPSITSKCLHSFPKINRRIMYDVFDAVRFMHNEGIAHRDLKVPLHCISLGGIL